MNDSEKIRILRAGIGRIRHQTQLLQAIDATSPRWQAWKLLEMEIEELLLKTTEATCPKCNGTQLVAATPGQPGDGTMPCECATEEPECDYTPEEALAEARKRWSNEAIVNVDMPTKGTKMCYWITSAPEEEVFFGDSFRACFAAADKAES